MSISSFSRRWQVLDLVAVLFGTLLIGTVPAAADDHAVKAGPGLAQPLSAQQVAEVNFNVLPTGEGLPNGAGTARQGEPLYQANCLACHGVKGAGSMSDRLAGGHGTLASASPVRTVGSYWPYATTLFDYIRRAMPYQTPGVLSDDEVYAVTAYLLFVNGIVEQDKVLNAQTLPQVRMPNRDNFVWAVERP